MYVLVFNVQGTLPEAESCADGHGAIQRGRSGGEWRRGEGPRGGADAQKPPWREPRVGDIFHTSVA